MSGKWASFLEGSPVFSFPLTCGSPGGKCVTCINWKCCHPAVLWESEDFHHKKYSAGQEKFWKNKPEWLRHKKRLKVKDSSVWSPSSYLAYEETWRYLWTYLWMLILGVEIRIPRVFRCFLKHSVNGKGQWPGKRKTLDLFTEVWANSRFLMKSRIYNFNFKR